MLARDLTVEFPLASFSPTEIDEHKWFWLNANHLEIEHAGLILDVVLAR